jgi:hypothetical protein
LANTTLYFINADIREVRSNIDWLVNLDFRPLSLGLVILE